jgi:predicted nucleotidyltransferase
LADSTLSEPERQFLEELNRRGVRYLLVGVSAAVLQGATTATQDVDLWFETLDDPGIAEAARAAGGVWIPGGFGARPPAIGGEALGDRFDVVVHMHGLASFNAEYQAAKEMTVDGIPLRVLPLERIIESKRALGRKRDIAQIPALEEALAALSVIEPKKG